MGLLVNHRIVKLPVVVYFSLLSLDLNSEVVIAIYWLLEELKRNQDIDKEEGLFYPRNCLGFASRHLIS